MSARDRILDAAEACLRRDGIRRTTVRGVAEEAGLSRAYVYRLFADKQTLVSAALIRRDEAFWQDAHERISRGRGRGRDGRRGGAALPAAPLGPLALELAEAEPEAYALVMGTYVHEHRPGAARTSGSPSSEPLRSADWCAPTSTSRTPPSG